MHKLICDCEESLSGKVKYRDREIVRRVVLGVLMFMFVYSFPVIQRFGFLTSTRISSVLICIWGVFSQARFHVIMLGHTNAERIFRKYLCVNLFLLLYTTIILFVWGRGTGVTVTNIYLNILTFSVFFFYGCKSLFFDVEEFMQAILDATIIQCIIVLLSLVFPAVYSWIRTCFYSNSYFELTGKMNSMKGYALGIGCFTSKGAQKLSLGIVSCVYFILKKKHNTRYILGLILITFVSTAVARIGLVFFLVALLFILFIMIQKKPNKAQKLLLKIGLFAFIGAFGIVVPNIRDTLMSVFWRLLSLFNGGLTAFFKAYFNGEGTVIPHISIETLVGTGICSGTSGCGLEINADGGFTRTYFALGLILAVIYYSFLAYSFKKGLKPLGWIENNTGILFVFFLTIGEFKEPLLFDWYYQTLLFTFIILSENCVFYDVQQNWDMEDYHEYKRDYKLYQKS